MEIHIDKVNAKLQELLKRFSHLQNRNAQQKKEIDELNAKLMANDKKIKALEEQQYILKSAAGSLNDKEKKAFEQAISKYIREIDKCITMISE